MKNKLLQIVLISACLWQPSGSYAQQCPGGTQPCNNGATGEVQCLTPAQCQEQSEENNFARTLAM